MSTGYFPKREKVGLEDLIKGLVTASHILHNHGILDTFGHISVRSPDNKDTFYMSCNMAPALISSADEIVEYHVESAEAVEKQDASKPPFLERFIHSEIYKRFPDINSVVHSHAADVLPYCVCGVPLKATFNMAGFLGTCIDSTYSIISHPPNPASAIPVVEKKRNTILMSIQVPTSPPGTQTPRTPQAQSTTSSSAIAPSAPP